MGDAERSVTYADRSGDAGMRMIMRTTHADALHQAGRRAEAEARFREAEQMQAERQPAYPLLYSLRGFQYCDLLLAAAERAAWRDLWSAATGRRFLPSRSDLRLGLLASGGGKGRCRRFAEPKKAAPPQAKAATSRRTPKPATPSPNARRRRSSGPSAAGMGILTIALDHLTLGRAALYAAILQESPISNLKSEIEQAVSGLRRAGQHRRPPPRPPHPRLAAVSHGDAHRPRERQSDLDEAWEIAERGPMPLFLADIHLYRARLFGRPAVGEDGSVGRPATTGGRTNDE